MRLLLLACVLSCVPLCAQGFDVADLYARWEARERSHLLGRDVLDDDQLIERLEPLAGLPNDELDTPPKDWRAAALLGLGYLYGKAGAVKDAPTAQRYLLRATRASPEASYAAALCALTEDLPNYNPWKGQRKAEDFYTMGRMPGSLSRLAADGHIAAEAVWGLLSSLENPRDKAATDSLAKSAKRGCLPAKLWAIYSFGWDEVELTALVEQGYVPAAYALGMLYMARLRTEGDRAALVGIRARAHDCFIDAARLGDLDAAWELKELPEIPAKARSFNEVWNLYVRHAPALVQAGAGQSYWRCETAKPLADEMTYGWQWEQEKPLPTGEAAHRAALLAAEREIFLVDAEVHRGGKAHGAYANVMSQLAKLIHDLPDARARLADLRFQLSTAGSDLEIWARENMRDAYNAGSQLAKRRYFAAVIATAISGTRSTYFFNSALQLEIYKPPSLEESLAGMIAYAQRGDAWSAHLLADYFQHSGDIKEELNWRDVAGTRGDGLSWVRVAWLHGFSGYIQRDLNVATGYAQAALEFRESYEAARKLLADIDAERPNSPRGRAVALEAKAADMLNRNGDLDAILAAHPRLPREAAQGSDALLALCYLTGHGVLRDRARGLTLLESSEGGAVALYALALYHKGATVPDTERLVLCYAAAVNAGYAFGKLERGRLLRDGVGAAKDAEGAAALFKEAADAGCLPAMVEYAQCLRDGTGVQADTDAAKAWVKKAADEGWQPAKKMLDDWK